MSQNYTLKNAIDIRLNMLDAVYKEWIEAARAMVGTPVLECGLRTFEQEANKIIELVLAGRLLEEDRDLYAKKISMQAQYKERPFK